MEALLVIAILVAVAAALVLRPRRQEDLQGKVVLLTGAGGGFGRFLALALARRGCRIACVDVVAKPNEETASLVRQQQEHQQEHRRSAGAYTADLCKSEDIRAVVDKVIQDFGKIDILINNAGQLQGGALWEITEEQIDKILDVNLRAALLLTRAVVPHMKDRRSGHVVAVSSVSGRFATRGINAYSTSKAGLTQSMECLYLDLHHEGYHKDIHLTTIQPFFMNTFSRLQQAVQFRGPIGRALFSFMDAKECAEHAVKGIAEHREEIFMPGFLMAVSIFYRVMPRVFSAFLLDYVLCMDVRPAFSYDNRHKDMDPQILHELLDKGYPLNEDPEAVCRGLCDDYLAKSKQLPHNFAPFSGQIESFYRSRNQAVPQAVRRVFGIESPLQGAVPA